MASMKKAGQKAASKIKAAAKRKEAMKDMLGTKKPTKPTTGIPMESMASDPIREPKPRTSDCGGWGGVSNQKTNSRGGRRGR